MGEPCGPCLYPNNHPQSPLLPKSLAQAKIVEQIAMANNGQMAATDQIQIKQQISKSSFHPSLRVCSFWSITIQIYYLPCISTLRCISCFFHKNNDKGKLYSWMSTTGQSIRPAPGRGRTIFGHPVPFFPELARQVKAKARNGRHGAFPQCPPLSPTVSSRPQSSSVVPHCLPLFSVPHIPWQRLSPMVGLVVLAHDGHGGNSGTSTDYIVLSI